MGAERKVWLPFKYENLPTFYFYCGRMGHGIADCESVTTKVKQMGEDDRPYSVALRAESALFGKKSKWLGVVNQKISPLCQYTSESAIVQESPPIEELEEERAFLPVTRSCAANRNGMDESLSPLDSLNLRHLSRQNSRKIYYDNSGDITVIFTEPTSASSAPLEYDLFHNNEVANHVLLYGSVEHFLHKPKKPS